MQRAQTSADRIVMASDLTDSSACAYRSSLRA